MKIGMGVVFLCIGILMTASVSSAQGAADSRDDVTFTVERIVFAESVAEREPVGGADTFPASLEKVYCFLEAVNISQDTAVTFAWFHEGREMHTFDLPLMAGPRWRVHAYKNLRGMSGRWSVEIRDADGRVLKSASFSVHE